MKLKYNRKFINAVIKESDILVVAISDSKKFNKIKSLSDQRFYTNCLFHDDKHPSMILDRNTNTFKCKSTKCKKYGDVIYLTMHLYNLSFIQALKLLAYSFNIYLHNEDMTDIDRELARQIKETKQDPLYKELILQSEQKTDKINKKKLKNSIN